MISGGRTGLGRGVSLDGVSLSYCGLLVLLLASIEWFAEVWLIFAILLFAPPMFYALPFCILTPLLAWRKRWWHVLLHLACIGIVFGVFMTYRLHRARTGGESPVTVITHNIGQGDREAFVDYFPGEEPDIVLLQDAGRRRELFAKRFPTHRIKTLDQFVLLSPHTILKGDLVQSVSWRGTPVVARFELMIRGREVAVYNVHMPTPRPSLKRIFSPRVWLEMFGIADASTEGFPSYRAWLDARMALSVELDKALGNEKLPYLVGGDFNMPDHGRMYRLFSARMIDAFAACGNGWGFTFPGTKDSTAGTILGPWLRIDYLFAGRGWKPVDCRTADDARSQHRAVLGRFEPVK